MRLRGFLLIASTSQRIWGMLPGIGQFGQVPNMMGFGQGQQVHQHVNLAVYPNGQDGGYPMMQGLPMFGGGGGVIGPDPTPGTMVFSPTIEIHKHTHVYPRSKIPRFAGHAQSRDGSSSGAERSHPVKPPAPAVVEKKPEHDAHAQAPAVSHHHADAVVPNAKPSVSTIHDNGQPGHASATSHLSLQTIDHGVHIPATAGGAHGVVHTVAAPMEAPSVGHVDNPPALHVAPEHGVPVPSGNDKQLVETSNPVNAGAENLAALSSQKDDRAVDDVDDSGYDADIDSREKANLNSESDDDASTADGDDTGDDDDSSDANGDEFKPPGGSKIDDASTSDGGDDHDADGNSGASGEKRNPFGDEGEDDDMGSAPDDIPAPHGGRMEGGGGTGGTPEDEDEESFANELAPLMPDQAATVHTDMLRVVGSDSSAGTEGAGGRVILSILNTFDAPTGGTGGTGGSAAHDDDEGSGEQPGSGRRGPSGSADGGSQSGSRGDDGGASQDHPSGDDEDGIQDVGSF